MRMRLLLLGGGNLLGQSLIEQGALEGVEFHTPKPPKEGWNPDNLAILLQEVQPNCIINLAYYFDWFQTREVDTAKLSSQINIIEHLAKLCHQQSIILFQPSSYRVFGGTRITAYNEEDEPLPISVLGQALWQMEQIVAEECPKHVLVRFGWLLDYSADGKVGRLIKRAETLPEVQLADDRRGNPTPVDDAARVILGILQQLDCKFELWGTYHYGGMEATSSLAWGQVALAEARNYDKNLTENIIAKPHTDFNDATVEPQYSVLACKKILHTFGIKQRAWRAAIPELFKLFYNHSQTDK
ncbi:NAD(P)-dependent oxidoreductase [Entomomonas sp. E2T0]|uniref:NAD(P)-dependent oxidoreductase n=1 Tax=Entomomonas sp. E2T0 TaxID=2930213 RepID=UPI0022283934|nr:NAD(P)-dependent oxidoreductase [Entomomonas sp. E2T0]UYZ84335.1 NAD(P)-dependent oxidoreductase [Entomomonas sp. E2T0]